MKDTLQYKGYLDSVHYDDDDLVFFGKVEYIRSLVSYEGHDVMSLKAGFEEAVDDYFALCEHQGTSPEAPFKGSFNVRTGSDLHRRAVISAHNQGINLNTLISQALESFLNQG